MPQQTCENGTLAMSVQRSATGNNCHRGSNDCSSIWVRIPTFGVYLKAAAVRHFFARSVNLEREELDWQISSRSWQSRHRAGPGWMSDKLARQFPKPRTCCSLYWSCPGDGQSAHMASWVVRRFEWWQTHNYFYVKTQKESIHNTNTAVCANPFSICLAQFYFAMYI